ncbi:MAG: UDP-N-acetylglucosamine 1-carboxyvinyltransferase [Hungatella sp.]
MSTIQIRGLLPLKGEIEIQGSKNTVLPMMAASILHKGTTVLTHVPRIQDVFCMMRILGYLGCSCSLSGHELTIDAERLTGFDIPDTYVRSMRSSIMILGALLGRCGEAVTHYPGGCSIGKRPLDLHLYALRKLGAVIGEDEEMITAQAAALTGADISLSYPSVGATENVLLASVLADGATRLCGAAKEPEIEELCHFLNAMGAKITGIGTGTLHIIGVKQLQDTTYEVVGDRIVAGTYLAAAAAAGGHVRLSGIRTSYMTAVLQQFEKMGMKLKQDVSGICMISEAAPLPIRIVTNPYPGFPTDLQSPMMALLASGLGQSGIRENVFEGRYETAKELQKMGARIMIEEKEARIDGIYPLRGNVVEAKDLRGGAALIIAGLAAEGETRVTHCHHILRGYEDICRDLKILGAEIVQND